VEKIITFSKLGVNQLNTTASVNLWGNRIGAVTWDDRIQRGIYQYAPDFAKTNYQVSPLVMPLREEAYTFPELNFETFKGLPGMLADSLPDKFGNSVFMAWLSQQNRSLESINPVERLCYVGTRGMGALEFEPAVEGSFSEGKTLEVASLVDLANRIVNFRGNLNGVFNGENDVDALNNILQVGTSAGGARAKAIIAWNPVTNEFRSGQLPAESGFENWIIKFDGVADKSVEIGEPKGFGKIEFAYSEMAKEAGIHMTKCHLHSEGGRSHFMTKRFDRNDIGDKIHMQSLGALTHSDFNHVATYSYEQTLFDMSRLNVSSVDKSQQVLRAMFNVVARNQDDHVKNISFLMNKEGVWCLSPAYDITYSFRTSSDWVSQHQMIINGKRDNFELEDFIKLSDLVDIKPAKAKEMLEHIILTVKKWPEFAKKAKVDNSTIEKIYNVFRINLIQ
jgi:serine/threonine-protein kinase HipA